MNPQWLDTKAYPFAAKYFDIDGMRMHYVDEGSGQVILFVHGTPSWSFEFRHLIKDLSQNYRCIALDHIGFGLSDKPANADYSLLAHSKRLEALINHLQVDNIILVAHDFGGPIALRYATLHPEKIVKLILANTWCWSIKEDKAYKQIKLIAGSPLMPFLYRYFNFSAKYILPAAYGEKTRLTKEIHNQFTAPFSKPSERNGTVAFARSLVHDQDLFQEIGNRLTVLQNKPLLLLWGMKDGFVTPRYLERWKTIFPQAEAVTFEDGGHFVLDEKSFACIEALRKFLVD